MTPVACRPRYGKVIVGLFSLCAEASTPAVTK